MTVTERRLIPPCDVAFPPVPECLPVTHGLWGPSGEYQRYRHRSRYLSAFTAIERRAFARACAARCLPVWEAGYPDDRRPREAIEKPCQQTANRAREAAHAAAAYAAASHAAADAFAASHAAAAASHAAASHAADRAIERVSQMRLLTLYRPLIEWSSAWETETARGIANAIHYTQDYDGLPILADAFEEAGCDHPWLLDFLRHPDAPGIGSPGWWFLDKLTRPE
jgi:hypothetical protein